MPAAGPGRVDPRGRSAEWPSDVPLRGWWDILWRVYNEAMEDRLMLLAAGATFYLLLALFPFLASFVSLYGFVADPRTVADQIAFLGSFMPSGGVELIGSQLRALSTADSSSLSFGFLLGLAVALWSANNGVKALIEGLNAAYDENEKRSFIRLNLVSFAFTLGTIALGIFFLISVGVVPAVLAFLRLDAWTDMLIRVARWPVMLCAVIVGISMLYRFGPSREPAKWRWITWGAALASIIWVAASIGFSWYLQNFADYNATYGTLGAVIGFMIWTWISVTILFIGAELNAEMEHQTERDSTTGADRPRGNRGAFVADDIGRATDGSRN
ncbi:MAG: YihY/virulence factor BrkB family protein [Methylobacterium mesophilicum]|nr:YihY/virulence factor BrkB family protein [Methylobacterium mesophilicum]